MGRPIIDLTGQRFGRLVVLRMLDERRNNSAYYECRCDCGNIKNVVSYNLRSGNTTSCGCFQKERLNESHLVDCTGQRFGRLVAIRPTGERRRGYIVWECKCDCGNTAHVISSFLKTGVTTSCGCLQKESAFNTNYKNFIGRRFGKLTVLPEN